MDHLPSQITQNKKALNIIVKSKTYTNKTIKV